VSIILLISGIYAKEYSFEEILKLTLKNNRELKAKEVDIEISKLELQKAKSMDFGSLDLKQSFSYTDNAMYSFANTLSNREASFKNFGFSEFDSTNPNLLSTEPKDLNYPDSTKNFDTSINYSLNLFSGFQMSNIKEMAKLKLKISEVALQSDIDRLSFELLRAYNQSVANREMILALKKAKEASESSLSLSIALYEEGMVTKIDILEAKDRLAQIEAKLMEAISNFEISISYLKFLSSEDSIDSVNGFWYLSYQYRDLKSMQDIAIENRIDLQIANLNREILDKKSDFDRGEFLPKINLNLSYGFSDSSLQLKEDYYLIGTNMTYNLSRGGADRTQYEISRVNLQKINLQIEQLKRKIALDVESRYLNLTTLEKMIEQKSKSIELSTEVLQKSQEMYKNGLVSMSDLLLRESDLLRARAEYIKVIYGYTLAIANLKLAIGEKI
jgi:outer membrane protein TolC